MAGVVSEQTSRAIYDDALLACADPAHPCHVFRALQREVRDAEWQLPEPFNGASATAGIVFLGLNPRYDTGEPVPRIWTSFDDWDAFHRHRLERTKD